MCRDAVLGVIKLLKYPQCAEAVTYNGGSAQPETQPKVRSQGPLTRLKALAQTEKVIATKMRFAQLHFRGSPST